MAHGACSHVTETTGRTDPNSSFEILRVRPQKSLQALKFMFVDDAAHVALPWPRINWEQCCITLFRQTSSTSGYTKTWFTPRHICPAFMNLAAAMRRVTESALADLVTIEGPAPKLEDNGREILRCDSGNNARYLTRSSKEDMVAVLGGDITRLRCRAGDG
ncbi:hypothetical protein COCC4DRAFT_151164 [Bipolaris maydis ATCC 48331]|uniref:Uncharacterized protein n=2 Tax=Cochliobolus heterostrophus TaxID=5016 RepID=M2UZM0_COCH5|nr:uncharacterized protein COCC4DRAFT_151164 [Bipolaris maydis ATCC 48331]EMD93167.1 hypothetical protein COCHEDRAFT_1029381 [Bipolaris maydis C5]ENI00240.1 hypothetical protein COCC4DRAFT_151164 [Bipolaris maydis ATCC 48331]